MGVRNRSLNAGSNTHGQLSTWHIVKFSEDLILPKGAAGSLGAGAQSTGWPGESGFRSLLSTGSLYQTENVHGFKMMFD